MLFFLFLFLVLLLLLYLVRVVTLEGNGPNSFIVIPLLLGILLTGIPEFRWQSGETKGAHLITYVSGVTDSELKCQRLLGAFYDFNPEEKGSLDKDNPKIVHIKYGECMELVNWFASDTDTQPATSKQAFALHLLIFEASKVGTNLTPLEAECKATARYIEVATYAGTSVEEANRMLDMYKSDWYPYLSEEFRKPCN
jgi:hypothetical protein